jgi:hypothetical protein
VPPTASRIGAAFELFARDGRRVLSAFAHTLVDDPRVDGDFRCGRGHFAAGRSSAVGEPALGGVVQYAKCPPSSDFSATSQRAMIPKRCQQSHKGEHRVLPGWSGLDLNQSGGFTIAAMTPLDRPALDQPSVDTDAAVNALLHTLQRGYDIGHADVYDEPFAEDILWGTPKGQVVHGFAHLNAIHRQMMGGKAVTPASRFEIVQTTSPAPGVVVTQIRRRALNGEFSEMAMYVLAKRAGRWWVAGAQNTPVSDALPQWI